MSFMKTRNKVSPREDLERRQDYYGLYWIHQYLKQQSDTYLSEKKITSLINQIIMFALTD